MGSCTTCRRPTTSSCACDIYNGFTEHKTNVLYLSGTGVIKDGSIYHSNKNTSGSFTAADWDILPTIKSDTYANWAAKKTASTLPSGQWIFISDKNVYLFCLSTNKLSIEGIYLQGGFYNQCAYTFDDLTVNSGFRYIIDSYGNNVASQNTLFLFNNVLLKRNTVSGSGWLDARDAKNTITDNVVQNSGKLIIGFYIGVATNAVVTNNTIIKGTVTTGKGTVNKVYVDADANIILALNDGVSIQNCSFVTDKNVELDPTVSYSNKHMGHNFSTFDTSATITGSTTLSLSSVYGAHIGVINLVGGTTEVTNLFANAPQAHPFRIYPPSNMTSYTLTHGTGANQPICSGGVNAVLNGSKGDWIEFTYNATRARYYETNRGSY